MLPLLPWKNCTEWSKLHHNLVPRCLLAVLDERMRKSNCRVRKRRTALFSGPQELNCILTFDFRAGPAPDSSRWRRASVDRSMPTFAIAAMFSSGTYLGSHLLTSNCLLTLNECRDCSPSILKSIPKGSVLIAPTCPKISFLTELSFTAQMRQCTQRTGADFVYMEV